MTARKRRALATSMMAAKARGELPCYETAVTYCKSSSFNTTTQAPFSRGTINRVLTTDCYDETPDHPWEFRYGTKRRPLRCSGVPRRSRAHCLQTAGPASTTGDRGRSPAITSLLAVSTDSSFGLAQMRRRALMLSHPTLQTSCCTRARCPGCDDWRSRHGLSGLGRRHLASWKSVCSKPCAGSTGTIT